MSDIPIFHSVRSIVGEPVITSEKYTRKELTRRVIQLQAVVEAMMAHLEEGGARLAFTTKGLVIDKPNYDPHTRP